MGIFVISVVPEMAVYICIYTGNWRIAMGLLKEKVGRKIESSANAICRWGR